MAFRRQNYRFVTNCYIINLAITDLLFLLISVPLTTYLGLTNTWILDGFVSCRIHIYFAHVSDASCRRLGEFALSVNLKIVSFALLN